MLSGNETEYLVKKRCDQCLPEAACSVCDGQGYTFHFMSHQSVLHEIENVLVIGSRRRKCPPRNGTGLKLYVSDSKGVLSEAMLRRVFSFYGTVRSIKMPPDVNGVPCGPAIVEMSHSTEVDEILCTEDRLYGERLFTTAALS